MYKVNTDAKNIKTEYTRYYSGYRLDIRAMLMKMVENKNI